MATIIPDPLLIVLEDPTQLPGQLTSYLATDVLFMLAPPIFPNSRNPARNIAVGQIIRLVPYRLADVSHRDYVDPTQGGIGFDQVMLEITQVGGSDGGFTIYEGIITQARFYSEGNEWFKATLIDRAVRLIRLDESLVEYNSNWVLAVK